MMLGHYSASFTLSTYVHLLPDDLPDAPPLADVEQSVEQPPAAVPAEETKKPAIAALS